MVNGTGSRRRHSSARWRTNSPPFRGCAASGAERALVAPQHHLRVGGGPQRRHVREQAFSNFGQIMANHRVQLGSHSLSGVAALELDGGEETMTRLISVPPNNNSHLVNLVDLSALDSVGFVDEPHLGVEHAVFIAHTLGGAG